jgi:hypothetical protein
MPQVRGGGSGGVGVKKGEDELGGVVLNHLTRALKIIYTCIGWVLISCRHNQLGHPYNQMLQLEKKLH